jgi:hypothetical protein
MKIQKRNALLVAVLVPAITLLALLGWWLVIRLTPPKPQPPLFKPNSQFAIGVNYPWRYYGGDFGANVWGSHEGVSAPQAQQEVDKDFAYLSSKGLNVVRWFMFTDGRGGLQFGQDGSVTGIDPYVLDDIAAALAIAHKHNIRIIFVLFDFNFAQKAVWGGGQRIGGHRKIIEKPALTQTFLNNALAPILKQFGTSTDVAAWEIMNEPEWVMTQYPYWQTSKIGVGKMQTFVRDTALFIKMRAKQPVTLGSASQSALDYWDNCNLDFLQFHSYPNLEKDNPLDTPAPDLGHSIPIILGEFPTDNTKISTDQYFDLMYKNGYLGAIAWSFRATDKYTNLAKQLPAIAAWQKAHALQVKHP